MNIKSNIEQLLEPLNIYNLHEQNETSNEILTYSTPLQQLNNQIDELINEAFIQTANNYGLQLKEELLFLDINPNTSLDIRRNKILHALLTNPDNFTKNGIINSLKSTGFYSEITENYSEESITISQQNKDVKLNNITKIKNAALKILPAHLDVIFNIGNEITWNKFEEMAIDPSKEFCWDDFETQ